MNHQFRDQRIVVMGLGRFGGGIGVTRYLVQRGADVLVTDTLPAEKLRPSLEQLAGLRIDYRLGGHDVSDFITADLIVVNPAVNPHQNPYLKAALERGVQLTSEIRLLLAELPARQKVIAVTGTAGKSTTTAMIGHAMTKLFGSDRVHLGGNLGGSLLGNLHLIRPDHWVILELSSFMLHMLRADRWSPHVALITHFAPNHLDWHASLEEYRSAKQVILDFQTDRDDDWAILGPDLDSRFTPRVKNVQWRNAPYPSHGDALDVLELLVPGNHNRLNATLACDAVHCVTGEPWKRVAHTLRDFAGLPHRLQLVAEHAGVRYFNDSKATTPDAAILALLSFPAQRVHIILGGHDKGSDLTELAQLASRHAKALYAIGQTAHSILTAAQSTPPQPATTPAYLEDSQTLDLAMQSICTRVAPGDIVLLSPGCASYGQYENYEYRGRHFAQLILQYTGEPGRAFA